MNMDKYNYKSQQPKDTPFRQQKLKSWQPIPTAKSAIMTFLVCGLLFIIIGVILFPIY